jgi:peptide/nickel transport system permease protein
MTRHIVWRLIGAVPTVVGVVVVTFLLTRALPADPAVYFAGLGGTAEAIEQVRVKLGLDRSLATQFALYVKDLLHGDLGRSLTTGQPVLDDLLARLPASFELTLAALLLATAVAIPLGVLAATRPDSWFDHLCRLVMTAGVALPTFFTGLILVHLFYFELGWAPPPVGRLDAYLSAPPAITRFYLIDSLLVADGELFIASLRQILLPTITLAVFAVAPLARATRAAMLEALASDFIRTAWAMGLDRRRVLYVYALQNALLPVLTTLGMVFSFLLGANVLVEKVFAWPGIGSYAIEALIASDYAPVQGFVLTMACLYVLLNLTIDLLYVLVDPRAGEAPK